MTEITAKLIVTLGSTKTDPWRIHLTFKESVKEMLGDRVVVQGDFRRMITITPRATKETLARIGDPDAAIYSVSKPKHGHVILELSGRYAGVALTNATVPVEVRFIVISDGDEDRLLSSDLDLLTIQPRVPVFRRSHAAMEAEDAASSTRASVVPPQPPALSSDRDRVRAALVLVREIGLKPLNEAVVTLVKLCAKNGVALRLDDDKQIRATVQEEFT